MSAFGIICSLAAIGVSVVTILRMRCMEMRQNAEIERRARQARAAHERLFARKE